MANSEGFLAFVLDQLDALDVTARKMFGEVGLYSGPVFFGIVADDVLYLRVADSNRETFEAVDSSPFRPFPDRPPSRKYFSVPASVLESPADLVSWTRAAIEAAQTQTERPRPAAAPAPRARPRTSTAGSSRARKRR